MKGFILKPHEAQALAAGKPVVIWRACKPQPVATPDGEVTFFDKRGSYPISSAPPPFRVGVPLFVKETWSADAFEISYKERVGEWVKAVPEEHKAQLVRLYDTQRMNFRPPSHMPEWASRITLTLSDVKVRRPQDADEADILASGVGKCPKREGLPQYYTFPGGITDHDPVSVLMKLIKTPRSNLYHFTDLATPQPKDS